MDLLDLEKPAAAFGGHVLDLVKVAFPLLDKHGLNGHVARVGICLDVSLSMQGRYRSGEVQELVDRIAAMGVMFDDNAAFDLFAFHNEAFNVGEVDANNFEGCVDRIIKATGWGGTDYAAAMRCIREHYFGRSGVGNLTPHAPDGEPPVYMLFITDGATNDEGRATAQIAAASYEPMFVQFVALGADYDPNNVPTKKTGGFMGFGRREAPSIPRAFSYLAALDDMGGRHMDNAGFFAVQSPHSLPDEDFFDRMMGEYPAFLQQAAVQAMLRQ